MSDSHINLDEIEARAQTATEYALGRIAEPCEPILLTIVDTATLCAEIRTLRTAVLAALPIFHDALVSAAGEGQSDWPEECAEYVKLAKLADYKRVVE